MSRPTVSFELMPPRTPQGHGPFWETVASLMGVQPDFVSVTYGAGGNSRETARAVTQRLVREAPFRTLAHLTCVGATRRQCIATIDAYLDAGVRAFLALRGDPPAESGPQPGSRGESAPEGGELTSAIELLALVRQRESLRCASSASERLRGAVSPLAISVATFPAGNPAARTTPEQEIARLFAKQAAGASFAVTQLFYDAEVYLRFVDQASDAGVEIPILAGILPPTNPRRLRRTAELTGVAPDPEFLSHLESASPEEQRKLGIESCVRLVDDIIASGAPGVHMYTFNQAEPALQILGATGLVPAPVSL